MEMLTSVEISFEFVLFFVGLDRFPRKNTNLPKAAEIRTEEGRGHGNVMKQRIKRIERAQYSRIIEPNRILSTRTIPHIIDKLVTHRACWL